MQAGMDGLDHGAPGAPVAPTRALVGREDELGAGAAFLEGLSQSGGLAALILAGEAGIGKSTLWQALVDEAGRRGFRVLRATPALDEGELGYAALTDLLRNVDPAIVEALPEPQRHGLQVARLAEPPSGPHVDPRSVAAGLGSVITALAGDGPALIAIDDVQWLDVPTRDALAFSLRRLEQRPVGVLLGLRGDGFTATSLDLERAMPDQRLRRLDLQPLSLAALFHLLRERLGRPFGRSTLARIADWSGGNPLYALEIGRAILAAGRLPSVGEPPPVASDLAVAVADRLRGLPQADRRTLLVAAALARPTIDQVRQACRILHWPMRLSAGRDFVGQDDGGLRFAHPLIRTQALRIATTGDLAAVHRALAALSANPEERARHLALAADGPDPVVAEALDAAVRAADARGAPAAAADLAELACRLTPSDDRATLLDRRWALGRSLALAGDTARARDILGTAIGDGPPGPVRAMVMIDQAKLEAQGFDRPEAVRLWQVALSEAGDDRIAQATVELAWTDVTSDRLGASDHARRALELLVDGPAALQARAMAGVAVAEAYRGQPVPWSLLEEAVAIEKADPPARVLDWAAATLAWELTMADEFERAHEAYLALRQAAIDRGDESSLARIDVELAQIDLRRGAWEELPDHAAEAIAVAERNGREHDRVMGIIQLAALAAARGIRAEAEPLLSEAEAYAERIGDAFMVGIVAGNQGSLALAEGDAAAARQAFERLGRAFAGSGVVDAAMHRYQADMVEALVRAGDSEAAASLVVDIEARAEMAGRRRPLALAARGRAVLAAAQGDLDAALAAGDRSVDELTRLGLRYQAARSVLIRGIIHRRRREKRSAHGDLTLALGEFEALRAVAWAEQTRRELRRVGLRPRAPLELTDTEHTVARYAAEGMTTREIAALAFMSPRTVEGVLGRAYAKLGVRSRAELGRAMTAKGAAAD